MYEIEKMTLAPRKSSSRKGKSVYPLRQLKVGEGFYAPLKKKGTVASLASRLNKELGWHLSVVKMDDERIQVMRREDPR